MSDEATKERMRIVRLIEREAKKYYSVNIAVWAALNGIAERIETGKAPRIELRPARPPQGREGP